MENLGIDLDVHCWFGSRSCSCYCSSFAASGVRRPRSHWVWRRSGCDPMQIPSLLVTMVSEWLAGQAAQRAAFYSAGEGPEEVQDSRTDADLGITPPAIPTAKAKEAPKKRVTAAAVQEQLSGLLELIPSFQRCLPRFPSCRKTNRQCGNHYSREHCGTTSEAKPDANFRYCGGLCQDDGEPTSSPGGQAQPTSVSGLDSNAPHQVVAEETSPIASDPIARAVMEQSKALMCLVASMQQGGDQLVQRILGYQKISRKRKASAGFSSEIRECLFCCPAKCCEEAEACLPTRIFLWFIIWNASEATGHTKSWGWSSMPLRTSAMLLSTRTSMEPGTIWRCSWWEWIRQIWMATDGNWPTGWCFWRSLVRSCGHTGTRVSIPGQRASVLLLHNNGLLLLWPTPKKLIIFKPSAWRLQNKRRVKIHLRFPQIPSEGGGFQKQKQLPMRTLQSSSFSYALRSQQLLWWSFAGPYILSRAVYRYIQSGTSEGAAGRPWAWRGVRWCFWCCLLWSCFWWGRLWGHAFWSGYMRACRWNSCESPVRSCSNVWCQCSRWLSWTFWDYRKSAVRCKWSAFCSASGFDVTYFFYVMGWTVSPSTASIKDQVLLFCHENIPVQPQRSWWQRCYSFVPHPDAFWGYVPGWPWPWWQEEEPGKSSAEADALDHHGSKLWALQESYVHCQSGQELPFSHPQGCLQKNLGVFQSSRPPYRGFSCRVWSKEIPIRKLDARFKELEKALDTLGLDPASQYHRGAEGHEVPEDNDAAEELRPYRPLDAGRIRLTGTGNWECLDFLSDVLYMPFVEPDVIRFDVTPPDGSFPDVRDGDPEEVKKLCLIWDANRLLRLIPRALGPADDELFLHTRVFGNFNHASADRQIGDRRGRNFVEGDCFQDHPMRSPMLQLCCSWRCIRRCLLVRLQTGGTFITNLRLATRGQLPTLSTLHSSSKTSKVGWLMNSFASISADKREHLGRPLVIVLAARTNPLLLQADDEAPVFAACGALLQGDHLGVEIACCAHAMMLEEAGCHPSCNRLCVSQPIIHNHPVSGLVIDDFFVLSSEDISGAIDHDYKAPNQSRVFLDRAKNAYKAEGIIGSDDKEVLDSLHFRVIGAEVNSTVSSVQRGLVCLGAPAEKRLCLMMLSVNAASLPYTTDALHATLVGSWISVLLHRHRRPMMSHVNKLFQVIGSDLDTSASKLGVLPRAAAEELLVLPFLGQP